MRISPLSQGTGVPAADVGNTSTQRTSPDRIAAAKAIAAGQERPQSTDPQVERLQANIRKIKMRTQMSTDRIEDPAATENIAAETEPSLTAETQNGIPDTNEQTPAVTDENKPLSPQFAALAKQRRALQQERAAFEKEKAEFKAQPTDGNAESLLGRIKSEPLRVLDEAGVLDSPEFYNALTDRIQNGSNPALNEIRALKAEIKSLKEGVDKTFTDRDTQAEQQVLSEMKRDADRIVAQGDTYEMVRATNSVPQAIELIHRTYKKTGEVMDVEEALGLIENELINDALKLAQVPKLKSRLTPTPEAQQTLPPMQNTGMRTLTNRDGARPQLDRRARALAAFHGTLKK